MIDVQGNLKAQKNPSPTISRNFGLGVGMGRWGWAGGVWWRKRRTGHKGEEEGGGLFKGPWGGGEKTQVTKPAWRKDIEDY